MNLWGKDKTVDNFPADFKLSTKKQPHPLKDAVVFKI